MNKLFICCIIVLFCSCLQAQTTALTPEGKVVILNSDRTWRYQDEPSQISEIPIIGEKYCMAKNGKGEFVRVEIDHIGEGITQEMLNKMTKSSFEVAKMQCKNQVSFVPRSIRVFESKGKLLLSIKSNATNSYGALGEITYYAYYTLEGEFLEQGSY